MEEKKGLIKTKKQMFIVIGVFTLVMLLGTVTYAFFNYTRTGSSNVIKTGRISFNTTQDGNINLTNVFPITSSEAQTDTTNAKSVTINVTGDTDYSEGLEYLVTLADVNLEANGKTLPIALEITQEGLGTEEEGDYYTAHTSYTTDNKYKVLYDGKLKNDARVLAGYIAPNTVSGTSNNTSGTITIKAYIDKSKILISDTYPEKTVRKVKTEEFSATACETATGLTSGSSICASATALQTELDSGSTLTSNQITALLNAGIITEYTDGTTNPEGKTVFTTNEWNGIQGSPLSFKVKVESNEGKWIKSLTAAEYILSSATLETTPYGKVYSGANVANYVIFNDELWRIIGVYGDKIKIVKNEPLEAQQYNDSTTSNVWSGSVIQKYLENTYYPTLSTEAKKMIEENGSWNVGGANESYDAFTAYENSIVTTENSSYNITYTTPWIGKIGLIASYEYLFAAENNGTCWTTGGNNYYNMNTSLSCGNKDWLSNVLTTNGSSYAWTLTFNLPDVYNAIAIDRSETIYHKVTKYDVLSPAVYLKSNVTIAGGDGISADTAYTLSYIEN